jgi:hypothetical protein
MVIIISQRWVRCNGALEITMGQLELIVAPFLVGWLTRRGSLPSACVVIVLDWAVCTMVTLVVAAASGGFESAYVWLIPGSLDTASEPSPLSLEISAPVLIEGPGCRQQPGAPSLRLGPPHGEPFMDRSQGW